MESRTRELYPVRMRDHTSRALVAKPVLKTEQIPPPAPRWPAHGSSGDPGGGGFAKQTETEQRLTPLVLQDSAWALSPGKSPRGRQAGPSVVRVLTGPCPEPGSPCTLPPGQFSC